MNLSSFARNIPWKIFSLVCAVAIWALAIEIENPIRPEVFNRPLEVRNLNYLTENDFVLLNEGIQNSLVGINVRSREHTSVIQENIVPFIDLKYLQLPLDMEGPVNITIPVQIELVTGAYLLTPVQPAINLNIDRLMTIDIPIEIEILNQPLQGFAVEDVLLHVSEITITGPAGVIENAHTAVVTVDMDNLTTDYTGALIPIIKDEEREIITGNFSRSPEHAIVTVRINQVNTIPLTGPLLLGSPAQGFILEGVSVTPQTVQVHGPPEIVANISQISLGEIDIAGLTASQVFHINVQNLTDDLTVVPQQVNVHVNVSSVVEEPIFNLSLPLAQIEVIGMEDNIEIQPYISLTVRGFVNISAITGMLDVTGLLPGTHNVEVSINLPAGSLTEPAFAAVTVTEDEEPEEIEPEEEE